VPERWTRAVLRFRIPVLLAWLAVLVVGLFAAHALPRHLSNVFTVPGTESDSARQILQDRYGERPDGIFTIVFRAPRADLASTQRKVRAAARLVPGAHATRLRTGGGLIYGEIDSTLDLQHAKGYTTVLRRALAGSRARTSPASRRSSTTSSRCSRTTCCAARRSRCRSRSRCSSRCSASRSPCSCRSLRRLHDHATLASFSCSRTRSRW
jgi:Predicted drug exporters of the RND superfamily